jgi:hypothetical protein
MTGAHAQHVVDITRTLERSAARVEEHRRDRWSFLLSDGAGLRATAVIDDGWLLLDGPLPESRDMDHDSRFWQLLQWNATLPGGAKFAVLAAGPEVHVRAELPLDDDVNLPRRVVQVCAGLNTAAARLAHREALGSPLSPREGHGEGAQWIGGKNSGPPNPHPAGYEFVPDLAEQCRASGWTLAERAGGLVVELDDPGSFRQAIVEAKAGHGTAVRVDVATNSEAPATPCREALALLLLRTSGIVRMVRATGQRDGSAARVEVLFTDPPCASELAHAFSALSVACRIAGREAAVLQHDERVASEYLRVAMRNASDVKGNRADS